MSGKIRVRWKYAYWNLGTLIVNSLLPSLPSPSLPSPLLPSLPSPPLPLSSSFPSYLCPSEIYCSLFYFSAEPDANNTGILNAVSESCDEQLDQDSGIKVRRTSVKRSKSVAPKYAGKGSTLVVKPQGRAWNSMVTMLYVIPCFVKPFSMSCLIRLRIPSESYARKTSSKIRQKYSWKFHFTFVSFSPPSVGNNSFKRYLEWSY